MKRTKGTKHRGASRAPKSEFLELAKRLVTDCASSGKPMFTEALTRTPYGTVKITMRAEMLVEGAPRIVRPT